MESVRQSCRPRHQVLTLKCYPKFQKGVPEVKPNPSELSYLLYYASTRRSKLTKVGAFLEKRVAKDVWRRRLGNVQVALHILTALIEKVPRDLPIYARYVLSIIETILQANDVSMVEDSIATFDTFCRHQDPAVISADQGLAKKYRQVIETYAGFANPHSPNYSLTKLSPPLAIRWRNAGLRAIRSIVSSESLAADGGSTLHVFLPVILENLYSPDENILEPLKVRLLEAEQETHGASLPRRSSIATVNTVDAAERDPALAAQSTADADKRAEMDSRLMALRCLEQIIVSGSSRGQIRIAATAILRFISDKHVVQITDSESPSQASHSLGNWATSLIELVATWCPVQVRFVILTIAMDLLADMPSKEDTMDPSFTLLSVVDWLLKSPINMIGLSVMDILLGLMRYMSDLISLSTGADKDAQYNDTSRSIPPKKKAMLALLEQCIGSLATHNYYGDQVADMMRTILRQLTTPLNHENATQPSLATVHETGAGSKGNEMSEVDQPSAEKATGEIFVYPAAKLTALRAVKSILVVANLRTPSSIKGSESRNPVGIHVWEGTQGLLRDNDQEVRHAYVDAFLSWLQLETTKQNLKARVSGLRTQKAGLRRDPDSSDKTPNRRSTSANHRESVINIAQSNFLRLIHLGIYEAALDNSTVASEILVLHLLLASLVENLGVNAVQFGLPMVLKLQDDLSTSVELGSPTARVNVGSLIYGYLLAVIEKFNLEATPAGNEVRSEVQSRQSKGHWLSKIKLPPAGLDCISLDEKHMADTSLDSFLPTSFSGVDGLAEGIEEAYCQFFASPPQSPKTSASHGFEFPVLSHGFATQLSSQEKGLPNPVKENLLSSWSRESCLAAVEKDSAGTASISGSRGGTMTRNSHLNGNLNGSPVGSALALNVPRSIPDISYSPETNSGRASPVRVNDLRRELSVTAELSSRRRSPLRGQLGASNASILSSGSESMASGAYSISEASQDAVSTMDHETRQPAEESGIETPRAFIATVDPRKAKSRQMKASSLKTALPIPGGFPNDSQRSLTSTNRPSTAPYNSQSSSGAAPRSESFRKARTPKTLDRNKSRSSHNIALGYSDGYRDVELSGPEAPLDFARRDELKKLLDGFLTTSSPALPNGSRLPTDVPPSQASTNDIYSGRRQVSGGGLGRPPY
ncbi:Protein efr3 [Penicillium diatomitis]|uniref:Protein efr3 n=1 Tax=Penicillium diatomitis TaxID=2819901 RepID=A0A9W9WU93_9EURO|nr:Protein efr3 [Penicillium diatomitis]KAJ5475641.1 Protein efr3 [Penicillium diatomitis]